MGAIESKAEAFEAKKKANEEAALGPPSKTMDASEYCQELLMLVSKTVESHLGILPAPGSAQRLKLEARQMITRTANARGSKEEGTMYYVKAKTHYTKWPWVFVKMYEPPLVTGVSRVEFRGMKKMEEEYKLVTF